MKVLLFGRCGCDSSIKIYNKLVNYDFEVTYVESSKRSEPLSDEILSWHGDYILSYRNLYFLPKNLLSAANKLAINFHPGPPEYPGSGCINFALYNNELTFGVTSHLMNEIIDNGKIIKTSRFEIKPNDNLETLLKRTHEELEILAMEIIEKIYNDEHNFIDKIINNPVAVSWRGKARKMIEVDKLQNISQQISKQELDKIIRSCHSNDFPVSLNLHGYKFLLSLEDSK